ncbi:unnamed protein product [Adineta steineri]|uniref:Uncharacterized protein n=1 Tax=Adineta steineri TaxID=433720 RepID=A0A814N0Y8_9BILA|nr:unnamed protein product [Adineta steineri]CAF3779864.1 unnamed protein product [Adineta steineri]
MAAHRSPSPSYEQSEIIITTEFSFWHTFKHHIPRFILTILIDIVFPLLVYFSLQKFIKPVYALLFAGTPPLLMVICKALISRTFDALGFLIFFGFVISGVVAIVTRNSIILLLEKSLVTGILSLIFGITLIPFQCCSCRCKLRPLAYYFYQDLVPTNREQIGLPENLSTNEQESIDEHEVLIPKLSDKEEVAKVYEWIYKHCSSFRFSCYTLTGIWSIGFLFEFLARLILILVHLSVNKIVIYGNIILSGITIICTLLTIMCVTRERKQTMIIIEQWKREQLNIH